MRTLKRKGIQAYAQEFSIFGIKSKSLGLLIGVLREKRGLEAIWGLYCYIAYRPTTPRFLANELSEIAHEAEYLRLEFAFNIVCRREAICANNGALVAGEYGSPGSKIIYSDATTTRAYDPYRVDDNVFHIHSISHICGDLFYVATGDTAKYLDVMRINALGCILEKRILKRNAGFTAAVRLQGSQWFGTDFSERPNYIFHLESKKRYFLPKAAFKEYVIAMDSTHAGKIVLVTKRLSHPTGHRFLFDPFTEAFSNPKPIEVLEYVKIQKSIPY